MTSCSRTPSRAFRFGGLVAALGAGLLATACGQREAAAPAPGTAPPAASAPLAPGASASTPHPSEPAASSHTPTTAAPAPGSGEGASASTDPSQPKK